MTELITGMITIPADSIRAIIRDEVARALALGTGLPTPKSSGPAPTPHEIVAEFSAAMPAAEETPVANTEALQPEPEQAGGGEVAAAGSLPEQETLEYLSAPKAAKHIGVSLITMYNYIRSGQIESVRNGRAILVATKWLDDFLLRRGDRKRMPLVRAGVDGPTQSPLGPMPDLLGPVAPKPHPENLSDSLAPQVRRGRPPRQAPDTAPPAPVSQAPAPVSQAPAPPISPASLAPAAVVPISRQAPAEAPGGVEVKRGRGRPKKVFSMPAGPTLTPRGNFAWTADEEEETLQPQSSPEEDFNLYGPPVDTLNGAHPYKEDEPAGDEESSGQIKDDWPQSEDDGVEGFDSQLSPDRAEGFDEQLSEDDGFDGQIPEDGYPYKNPDNLL